MTVYRERVSVSGWQRRIISTGVGIVGLAAFYYVVKHFSKGLNHDGTIGLVIMGAIFCLYFLERVHSGFFPDVTIEITDRMLVLKRGFVRRTFALEEIVETDVVPPDRVRRIYFNLGFPFATDGLFLDLKHLSNVRFVDSDVRTRFIASARAQEVANVLLRQSERARREKVLGLVSRISRDSART